MLLNLEDEINLEKIEDFKKPDTDPIKKKRIIRGLILLFFVFQIVCICCYYSCFYAKNKR